MNRLFRLAFGSLLLLAAAVPAAAQPAAVAQAAQPAAVAPDEKIRLLSTQILDRIRQDAQIQAGDPRRISQFVDEMVMPNVNFERMTALAVGRNWRQATPEQQKQLMAEFRQLLLRTYSGALQTVRDQTVRMKPFRGDASAEDVVVRSEVLQPRGGEPIQLDYRLERSNSDWRIYDVNVMGIWLVESYRNQFAQEVGARGIDGLIRSLADRNRQAASPAKS